jgi:transposase
MIHAKIQFKEYNQGQIMLFPCRLDDQISSESPVRLINQVVDQLDITPVMETYEGGGTTSYHPRMMLKVLFYGYMNNIYSCRKIEKALQENIHYMWLSAQQYPDFRTINNFRSQHLKDAINNLFTQVVLLLVEMGYISLKEVYIDGTKIEAKANRYTFVWRKSVEKNKAKLEAKIKDILSQVEEGIYSDHQETDEVPVPINSEELKERITAINRENRSKEEQKQLKDLEEKHLPKLQEYEDHLKTMGSRNSYSKTDPSATFMRMKEDHMGNGQLKPAYNVQIGTENQFITNFKFYPNPTDTRTFKSFLLWGKSRYERLPEKAIADAGYGSEENYEFMEQNQIEGFVKYSYFHKEQKRNFKNNPFIQENLYYNPKQDYFVCPMGQHMTPRRTYTKTNDHGYQSQVTLYQAQNCTDCPLRGMCYQAKEDKRSIEINHRLRQYKQKARELLTSEEGLKHRSRRPIEPEAVFGQIKFDKSYNRFRHTGKDKVEMDFAILSIAFNLHKLARKVALMTK